MENRILKFRAWDKKFKMMNEVLVMDFDSQKVRLHPDYNHQSYFQDIELMQFTGLHDKAGKEIYEGDIIASLNDDGIITDLDTDTGIGKVEFMFGMWYITNNIENSLYDIVENYSIEIIGNIFENADLLK